MATFPRYLLDYVKKDLKKKMVFVGGARQCGKTILSEQTLKQFQYKKDCSGLYLNWDDPDHRRKITKRLWGNDQEVIVFDELHKYPKWKSWLKGTFDTQKKSHRFFVTGSARLDVYRRGGDSLMGRYHYWRLHPFCLAEYPKKIKRDEAYKRFLRVGGFPEPFLDNSIRQANRWRKERYDRILKDDVRDLESIQNIQTLSLFVDALRERVGGLVVLNNIAEDLQVSPNTLKKWLQVLERMYVVFIVWPYTKKIPRAIQKPPKVYFYDNADVIGDEGACFENLVASHLLKRIHFLEDYTGIRHQLHYIRDKSGREVDFAIFKDNKLTELIEAKWQDKSPHRALQYYAQKLKPVSAIQIVGSQYHDSLGDLKIVPAKEYLAQIYY